MPLPLNVFDLDSGEIASQGIAGLESTRALVADFCARFGA
jgi:hypothetical protein